jgi:hypothetical protein
MHRVAADLAVLRVIHVFALMNETYDVRRAASNRARGRDRC